MNKILISHNFNQIQSIVLDLILEHWSATRAEILRHMLINLPSENNVNGSKHEVADRLLRDLNELSARRAEINRVNEVRAEELRLEVAEGHRNVLYDIATNFTTV